MVIKSELFEPLKLAHVQFCSISPTVQPDGSLVWHTHIALVVPSLVNGLEPQRIEYRAATELAAIPALEQMIRGLVFPSVAAENKLTVGV